jgi:hypothetical protein
VLSIAGLFLLVACGGSSSTLPEPSGSGVGTGNDDEAASSPPPVASPAPPASSATTPPVPPTTPPTPAAGCNQIDNDANAVGAQMVASAAPAPIGGAITDGTYHLTDVSLYTGVGGNSGPLALSIKQTISIHGDSVDVAEEANGKVTRLTEVITLAGSSVSMARTCPSAMQGGSGTYSVKGNAFVLFLVNDVKQTVSYTYSP